MARDREDLGVGNATAEGGGLVVPARIEADDGVRGGPAILPEGHGRFPQGAGGDALHGIAGSGRLGRARHLPDGREHLEGVELEMARPRAHEVVLLVGRAEQGPILPEDDRLDPRGPDVEP